ncbi:hypothetical protein KC19_5G032000 [Ceratodon purpureus]|nr:hypothetical protein KC19_5G032000 [Ceratodon purpureus]
MILFHPYHAATKSNILGYCDAFNFRVRKEWWAMNRLHLTSSFDPSVTTLRFGITLLLKTGPPASKFAFRPVPKLLSRHGVDVGRDDCLQNIVLPENQMCNGRKPWRGPREKSVVLMEMLIEACSDPGNVVFDCTAATGPSIHACRNVDRHIVALEADADIFKALLQPLIRTSTVPQSTTTEHVIIDDPEGEVPVAKILKRSRFLK